MRVQRVSALKKWVNSRKVGKSTNRTSPKALMQPFTTNDGRSTIRDPIPLWASTAAGNQRKSAS